MPPVHIRKLAGTCARCGRTIPQGSRFTWGKDARIFHAGACPDTETTDWTIQTDEAAETAAGILVGADREKADTPKPQAEAGLVAALEAALAPSIARLAAQAEKAAASVDEPTVRRLVADALRDDAPNVARIIEQAIEKAALPRPLSITINDRPPVDVGQTHKTFPELLEIVGVKCWPWISGPAGSGKTYACEQAAKALGLPFYFDGRTDTDYKLLGYDHPTRGPVETPFKAAFTRGGLYLADEIDAWESQACLALQAALSNGACPFPGSAEPVARHPDFVFIAAANTWGYGADAQYVGRNKLDAAFLDRFCFLPWDYDEKLERAVAGNDEVVSAVQKLRAVAQSKGLKVVISPRASIDCSKMVAAGKTLAAALDRKIFCRLPKADAEILRTVAL